MGWLSVFWVLWALLGALTGLVAASPQFAEGWDATGAADGAEGETAGGTDEFVPVPGDGTDSVDSVAADGRDHDDDHDDDGTVLSRAALPAVLTGAVCWLAGGTVLVAAIGWSGFWPGVLGTVAGGAVAVPGLVWLAARRGLRAGERSGPDTPHDVQRRTGD